MVSHSEREILLFLLLIGMRLFATTADFHSFRILTWLFRRKQPLRHIRLIFFIKGLISGLVRSAAVLEIRIERG
jgi:hypothetical protein